MDTRLIFRDFCVVRWNDEAQYVVRIIGFNVRAIRVCPGKSGCSFKYGTQVERKCLSKGRYDKARFQEKFLSITAQKPYRKPTQVVRSSRPRRTSEWSPRNSAKKQP